MITEEGKPLKARQGKSEQPKSKGELPPWRTGKEGAETNLTQQITINKLVASNVSAR